MNFDTGSSHPLSTVGFKWIELLEKEFDKSFLALDQALRNFAEDYEVSGVDLYETNRRLLSSLGSCFVQSLHKAQTVFENSAKQEATLLHLREELAEAKASLDKIEAEKKYLVCRLQTALLENHKLRSSPTSEVESSDKVCEDIQLKLANEMAVIQRVDWGARKLEERCRVMEEENAKLRKTQVELESELVGARLDSKYLDKELAGRIQQIQILLSGRGTSQDHKQKVWAQIEAEMHLQRSKTISNMCYSKQKVKDDARQRRKLDPMSDEGKEAQSESSSATTEKSEDDSRKSSYNGHTALRSRVKQVHIHKNDAEELGMAILGGHEHGLPIMISEVFSNTAVGRCRKICAGDVILAVNGDSFQGMGHHEAVKYLSSLRGTIKFDLENRVDDEIDDVCDLSKRYYEIFDHSRGGDDDGRGPIPNIKLSHPGRAKEVVAKEEKSKKKKSDTLPEVHHSPRKEKESNAANGGR